jgi:hypothetical protein
VVKSLFSIAFVPDHLVRMSPMHKHRGELTTHELMTSQITPKYMTSQATREFMTSQTTREFMTSAMLETEDTYKQNPAPSDFVTDGTSWSWPSKVDTGMRNVVSNSLSTDSHQFTSVTATRTGREDLLENLDSSIKLEPEGVGYESSIIEGSNQYGMGYGDSSQTVDVGFVPSASTGRLSSELMPGRHRDSECGSGGLSCSVCGKRYRFRSHLLQHSIIHTGDKPYKCRVCGAAFNRTSNLNKHMQSHLGQ